MVYFHARFHDQPGIEERYLYVSFLDDTSASSARTGLSIMISIAGDLGFAFSLGLAVMFVSSAIPKLLKPQSFRDAVRAYPFVPDWATKLLAGSVPLAELLSAALLTVPATRFLGALAATLLLASFFFAMGMAHRRKVDISCGCFGQGSKLDRADGVSMIRTGFLLAMAIVAMQAPSEGGSLLLASSGILAVFAAFLVGEGYRLVTIGSDRGSKLGLTRRADWATVS